MKTLPAPVLLLFALLGTSGSAAADPVTVKGELSFDYQGAARVLECKSGRTFYLGSMESNAFLRLTQRYWRLSFNGKTPVLIEVRGGITRTGAGGTILTLESPNVVTLNGGGCGDLPY